MTALAAALIISTITAAWTWWHSTHGALHARAKRTVIVTLKTGEAFRGVLYSSDRDCLVLRDAVAVAYGPNAENVVVEGEAVLLRSNVAYLQAT